MPAAFFRHRSRPPPPWERGRPDRGGVCVPDGYILLGVLDPPFCDGDCLGEVFNVVLPRILLTQMIGFQRFEPLYVNVQAMR